MTTNEDLALAERLETDANWRYDADRALLSQAATRLRELVGERGEMLSSLSAADIAYWAMRDRAEDAESALAEERAARERVEGWRPIETAPKDQTYILVFGPGREDRPYIDVTSWPRNWSALWPTAYMHYADGKEPTHWMPLPAPPHHASAPKDEPKPLEEERGSS